MKNHTEKTEEMTRQHKQNNNHNTSSKSSHNNNNEPQVRAADDAGKARVRRGTFMEQARQKEASNVCRCLKT